MLQKNGDIDEDVSHRIKADWLKWRQPSDEKANSIGMLRWICDHTRKVRVQNDDIHERLGVAPVGEKLAQHRLRWFGHIQKRPAETPIRNRIIGRTDNEKKDRGRPNLTWKKSVKRDLNDWCITKKLALDRRE
jgi:hypothetical protein